MVQQNCQGETTTSGTHSKMGTNRTTDDTEARADVWSIHGDFIRRHHYEARVQLYVSREETLLLE